MTPTKAPEKKFTNEDFAPDLGGLFDDFDSDVKSAYFGANPEPKYQAKLMEQGKSTDSLGLILELDSGGEKPINQWYSCGDPAQWSVSKDGSELTNVKDPTKHRFNAKSAAWSLVEQVILTLGASGKEVTKENRDAFLAKGQEIVAARGFYMTEVGFYTGLNFHWNQLKVKNPVSGEEANRLLPSKYLGTAVAEEAPKAAGRASAKAAVEEVSTEELDNLVAELSAGKTERELKQASIKNEELKKPAYATYVRDLVSGTKIADLEKRGVLTRGPDNKFV